MDVLLGILTGLALAIPVEILSLVIVELYDDYLIRKYEKQCKHICLFCKYKHRCDWYNK